jgi:hypothetical protein
LKKTLSIQDNLELGFKKELFLIVADYSIEVYNTTKFPTYYDWVRYIRKSLLSENLLIVQRPLWEITNKANKFFGFEDEDMFNFVMEYFIYEEYTQAYRIIQLIRQIRGSYVYKKSKKTQNGY